MVIEDTNYNNCNAVLRASSFYEASSSPSSFQRGALRHVVCSDMVTSASLLSGCGKVLEPGDVDDIEVALSTRKSDLDVMHRVGSIMVTL